MSKRKYEPGDQIGSFLALFSALNETGFIYAHDKIYHEGWVMSWQLKYVRYLMGRGAIRRAIKIKQKNKGEQK